MNGLSNIILELILRFFLCPAVTGWIPETNKTNYSRIFYFFIHFTANYKYGCSQWPHCVTR